MSLSRREFVQCAGAGLLLKSTLLQAQTKQPQAQDRRPNPFQGGPPFEPAVSPAKVAFVHGEDRRKNVYEVLMALDDQIKAGLARKKYVVIKPNNVSTTNPLAATNIDALHGILDYLAPRFRGPVVIAESSASDTLEGFDNFKYTTLPKERVSQKISLVDMNREGKYELLPVMDRDFHVSPIRLAARMLDPDAYLISSAMLKTHNFVVATMSVKNIVMGAPLHSTPGNGMWSDKVKCHPDIRQGNDNMLLAAMKLRPYWGLALIDGYEGMEGNGPISGTAVPSRVAIASTDLVAADRVGLELMGINPDWVGYLNYAGKMGLGQFDLAKIEIVGPQIAPLKKTYKLADSIQHQLQWMRPLNEAPSQSSIPQLHDYLSA